MAKKNLLAANLKRPTLKREMKVTERAMDEVVQKVADNPPPPAAKTKPPSPTSKASRDPAPNSQAVGKSGRQAVKAAKPKKGRGRPAKTTATRGVHPADGNKRLTLDIPADLHKKLKLLSIHQEISMKDYIIQVVERSLK